MHAPHPTPIDGTRVRCDHTRAWAALGEHYAKAGQHFDVRQAFAADAGRYAAFSQEAPHVFADLSRNRTDTATEALLLSLARECGLEQTAPPCGRARPSTPPSSARCCTIY